MDVVLAGTGPATGFPVPGCPCAACARAGTELPRRRPAGLQLGSEPGWWLDGDGLVHDPEGVVHRPSAGRQMDFPGFSGQSIGDVLLVRAGVADPLLWAPQAGRLSRTVLERLAGVELSAVFLGPDPDADPLDSADSAEAASERPPLVETALGLARLRAAGAVTERTRCLLIGLGHRQGQADRLRTCLAYWGAQAPLDGTAIALQPADRPSDPEQSDPQQSGTAQAWGGRTLVLGGSASGKSALAEHLLAARPEVVYTATGPVVDLRSHPDADWAQRVHRHRERRPHWWRTEETHEVAALLAKLDQPVLLDSIGTWLTGALDRAGAWQDRAGWHDRLTAETDSLVRAWRDRRAPLVAVTDEVGWGVVPATSSGRLFRDELGRLNRRLADESERVLVVVAGRILTDAPP